MKSVDCADIRDEFRAGTVPTGPSVDAHVRDCVRCAELFADEARLGRALASDTSASASSDELWAVIEGVVRAETGPRAWLRSRPTRQRLAITVVVAVAAVGLAGLKPRADWAAYPRLSVSVWFSLYSLGVLACLRVMLAPLGKPRPPSSLLAGMGVLALGLPLVYALGLLAPVVHAAGGASGHDVMKRAAGCFTYGLGMSAPFLALTWALERGHRLPSRTVLLAAAAGGLVANLALLVHCPMNDQEHLLLGHAPIGFATFLVFVAVSRFMTRRLSRAG